MDLGTYIMIDLTDCLSDLHLNGIPPPAHGYWDKAPPTSITAGTRWGGQGRSSGASGVQTLSRHYWPIACLDYDAADTGSEGSFSYQTEEGCTITMTFCCSYAVDGNYADITIVGNGMQRYQVEGWYSVDEGTLSQNPVSQSGHPVFCYFKVSTPKG